MREADQQPVSSPLDAWLTSHVAGYRGPGLLTKFAFGQSNPTFRLSAASGDYVIRRKPLGALLPKAHAIDREFRILRALDSTNVPVPQAFAYCDDPSIFGAAFFVMSFADGRIFYDQRLPGMTPVERTQIFNGMCDAIGKLHSVDPFAIGLEDFGKPQDFIARQIGLWTRQYRASEGARIEAMERLIEWLPDNIPDSRPTRIFHGDLRLDNMIFHPTEPRVIALLDWELSTLGDPLADFAYHVMAWRIEPDLFRGVRGLDRPEFGVPNEADYIRRYCAQTQRTEIPQWDFYLAFSLFRVAAILQGVWHRGQNGNASAEDAVEVGGRAAPLAALGWAIAKGAGARNDALGM